MSDKVFDIGQAPPLGEVPAKMHGWLIRPERFGEPTKSFQKEVIDVPEIADDEVLVYVMAAGVNYNNVWAALGIPVNVIAARNKGGEPEDFHIGGSDASGIVYKVGKDVANVKVGDEVVAHCGTWSRDCPWVKSGEDPMYSPSFRIWGYETNYGSFAQFTKVQAHQLLPKPKHQSWGEAAAPMLVGATAYRMLMGWEPHTVRPGDVVLIWGGAGGLGSMAIQIVNALGGRAIAVVGDEEKRDFCMKLGAEGCINRKDFDHWGMLPHWKDDAGYKQWLKGARSFGKAIWDVLGEKKSPRIVFEHPGETTIPTSIFVCDTGGMVVICAGTTGYNATVDLRYLWMRQKRLQGSHFANDEHAKGFMDLVDAGKIDPCLSQTFSWDQLPDSHQLMYENNHPLGNMSILVGASAESEKAKPVEETHAHPDTIRVPPREIEDESGLFIDDQVKVSELMKTTLVQLSVDQTVGEAAKTLLEHDIQAAVVTKNGATVGVLSQTDIVLARQGRTANQANEMAVGSVMTPEVIGCGPDEPVSNAISLMTRRRIHRLFVVENDNGTRKPVGVLAMSDIVRHMEKAGS